MGSPATASGNDHPSKESARRETCSRGTQFKLKPGAPCSCCQLTSDATSAGDAIGSAARRRLREPRLRGLRPSSRRGDCNYARRLVHSDSRGGNDDDDVGTVRTGRRKAREDEGGEKEEEKNDDAIETMQHTVAGREKKVSLPRRPRENKRESDDAADPAAERFFPNFPFFPRRVITSLSARQLRRKKSSNNHIYGATASLRCIDPRR